MGKLTDKGYQITTYNEYLDSIVTDMKRTIPGFSTLDSNPLMMLNKSVSSMLTRLSELGGQLYNSRSILTATGNALDGLVRNVGIRRKPENKSTGYVTFEGTVDTIIPAFTRVKTSFGVVYETTRRVSILENGKVTASIRALVGGNTSNVSEYKISVMVNPINGVTKVYNEQATIGGSDIESDVELRIRYFDTLGASGASTLASIQNAVMQLDNVKSVSILENVTDTEERGIPPHAIKVFVVGGEDTQILDSIYTHKAAGIETAGEIEAEYENKYIIRFARPNTASIRIALNMIVEYEIWQEGFIDTIKNNIDAYISDLKVGEDVQYHRVVGCVYNGTQGIKQFTLRLGKGTEALGTVDVTILEDEQATIDLNDITLETNFG